MYTTHPINNYVSVFWLTMAMVLLGIGSTAASPASTPDISNSLTQSYNADSAVVPGMLVELKSDQRTITPLTSKDARKMLGVVVPINDAPVVLTSQTAKTQQVLVSTTGRNGTLVSNQNGPVKAGDFLTVSAVSGVAMKAGIEQDESIGRADSSFDGKTAIVGTLSLKNSQGKSQTITMGRIKADLHLSPNPIFQQHVTYLPSFLVKAANAVANKPVSASRVYLSTVLVIASLFIAGVTLYGGVRSGIISIGRNPLSRKSIIGGLVQTLIAGLIMVAAGSMAAYLVLKI